MKLIRVGPAGYERPAVIDRGTAFDASGLFKDYDSKFWKEDGLVRLREALDRSDPRIQVFDAGEERKGPPISRPSKVICVGLNYADHIREASAETPSEPTIFMKAPNTVVGPDDDLLIPPGSTKTDYEVELGIVVGTVCRYLEDEEMAMRSIAGYAISNDVSEREFQLERGGQWVKGKSSETFNPLGPYLVTTDEVPDPHDLDLELKVNGETRQRSSTSEMIFSVGHIVWYLSQFMVLEPGDLINTGTPPGVGLGLDPPKYLKPGDIVELSISGLGFQRQTCLQGTA